MTASRIIATRPEKQNHQWQAHLQSLGFETAWLPLLEIVPVTASDEIQAIKNVIMSLDLYANVIFVSQNAVECGMAWIDKFWPQIPFGINWLAVGAKTFEQLARHPLMASENIERGVEAMNSEELLALESLQSSSVHGAKFLICKGKGGRTALADELILRGASVDYCALYSRGLPQGSAQKLAQIQLDIARDVVPIFSGESLENFVSLLSSSVALWQNISVVVPGERVAALAKSFGFHRIVTAKNASENSMLEALQRVA